jgi:hypothetical protein
MEKYKREEIKHYIFLTHKSFSLYARNECFKNSAIPAVRPLGYLVYGNFCKENLTCIEHTVFIVGLLYILRPPSCIIGNIIIQNLLLDWFSWHLILETLRKSVEKLQMCLKLYKNVRHFTWRTETIHTVHSSTKRFESRQRCNFHDNTQWFDIVIATLSLTTIQTERFVASEQKQSLREQAIILPYILKSYPHPNLIHTSFCRSLKRKKKVSSRF